MSRVARAYGRVAPGNRIFECRWRLTLILHARRGHNGWRDYDDDAVDRVRLIADMVDGGLTMDGVKRLAPCLEQHDPS